MYGNPMLEQFLRTIQNGPMDGSFNPYAAGDKRYTASGRSSPNLGPTRSPGGYLKRDKLNQAKRNYMLKRMQSQGQMRPAGLQFPPGTL